MSIKVLLVDDERLERVLIRNGFDWEQNGFEIIGEASSAEEAMEFVIHRQPEIVLTDISMPYVDGLELSEKIRQVLPNCHIVIVTGYREFEYAKRAVKIGVDDFLLKPVDIGDIQTVTDKIKEKMKKEQEHHNEVETLRQNILADKDIVMESFFQRLVEHRIKKDEGMHKLMIYSCEDMMKQCICMNIRLQEEKDSETDDVKRVLSLIDGEKYEGMICFVHYMKNIILYFLQIDQKQAEALAKELQGRIQNRCGLKSTIGISLRNSGYDGIAEAYRQSEKALEAAVILGSGRCISYSDYQAILQQNPDRKEIDWEDFQFCIANCLVERTEAYIDEYMMQMKTSGVTDAEYLRLMTLNMLSQAGNTVHKYAQEVSAVIGEDRLYEKISSINTLEEIEKYLKGNIQKIMQVHEKQKVKKSNKVVEEAVSYINSHLFDPELSLKLVASQIFSNESYLSRVFKQEMGDSLIEFITRRRIEESIQLMNTTDLKVYEIAERIGFRDSHYFSICFKKQMGVTIKEFKRDKFQE